MFGVLGIKIKVESEFITKSKTFRRLRSNKWNWFVSLKWSTCHIVATTSPFHILNQIFPRTEVFTYIYILHMLSKVLFIFSIDNQGRLQRFCRIVELEIQTVYPQSLRKQMQLYFGTFQWNCATYRFNRFWGGFWVWILISSPLKKQFYSHKCL